MKENVEPNFCHHEQGKMVFSPKSICRYLRILGNFVVALRSQNSLYREHEAKLRHSRESGNPESAEKTLDSGSSPE
jgi:hypothetical protein